MTLEIKIPSPGESISEVELATWFVEDGDMVEKNQELGEIESEKATLPLVAEKPGKIKILVEAGETVEVGTLVASIDTSVTASEVEGEEKEEPTENGDQEKDAQEESDEQEGSDEKEGSAKKDRETKSEEKSRDTKKETSSYESVKTTPVAREMMEKEGISVDDIIKGLKKITASDVRQVMNLDNGGDGVSMHQEPSRDEERKKISQLRKKISQRLVSVKNETAMLTTFNEVDMSTVMGIRKKYQDQFVEKHGIKLGFMSFFTKAVTSALKLYPAVNSYIDGEEVVTPAFCDVGIAVQTEKGLMVPVIRNVESLGLAEIEKQIADLASRARKARLGIEEMSGGTFTISNGGIYGSMLSTPILNPPQSGILGMHNIIERPVAVNGKVEIRPMMYIALSYDHRVIDGKDSVSFLKAVKGFIEDPAGMLFGAGSAEQYLLEI